MTDPYAPPTTRRGFARRSAGLAALSLVLGAVAAWAILLRDGRSPFAVSIDHGSSAPQKHPVPMLPAVRATRIPVAAMEEIQRARAPRDVGAAEFLTIRGTVFDARGFGLPRCTVELSRPRSRTAAVGEEAEDSRIESLAARTDGAGRFEVRAPATRWRWFDVVRVRVLDPSRTPIFLGPGIVEPEMLLQVAPLRRLHGRLVARDGTALSNRHLLLEAPSVGQPGGSRYAIRTKTRKDGSFSVRRRIEDCYLPEAFVAKFSPSGAGLLAQRVSSADLMSPQGAVVVADGVFVQVVVENPEGAPIRGGRVRAASSGWGGERWRSDFVESRTDERGRAGLWVAPGDVDLAVGAPGYGPSTRSLEGVARDVEVRFVLVRSSSVTLTGRVRDADDRPVAGARVLAFLRTESLELGAVCERATETTESGTFELAWPRAAFPCRLGIFHPAMPPLDWIVVRSPNEPIDVRCSAMTGDLVLALRASTAGQPVVAGPVRVHAVHRATGELRSVEWLDRNHVLRWLRPGKWNVAVSLPGGRWTGLAECEVIAGRTATLLVDLAPSSVFEGRIADRAAKPVSGLVVRLEGAAFGRHPPPWTSFRVGPSGSFRLQAEPMLDEVDAVVVDGDRVLARVRLVPGGGNRILVAR